MLDKKPKKFIDFYGQEEYLKHFDNIFETNTFQNIKFDNMKMLKKLYEYFAEELYNQVLEEIDEQLFIFGYIIASELNIELKNNRLL